MSENKNPKKKVTFEEVPNRHTMNMSIKKTSILKIKGKIKDSKNNNIYNNEEIKNLPTSKYIEVTVQKDIEQGLLNLAKLQPSNPIEFLGNYLIEKSKKSF